MKEEKHVRRERKRLAAANEPLPIRERLRNQWDVFEFERRMLEHMDQSVRYSLVIFTTANTFAVVVLTRVDILFAVHSGIQLAIRLLVALYALLAITILVDAARSLRPGMTPDEHASLAAAPMGEHGAGPLRVLQTLMPTGVDQASLAVLHDSWSTISGEELSRELTQGCLLLRSLVEGKYHALRRLYGRLAIMLVLAALIGSVAAIVSAV